MIVDDYVRRFGLAILALSVLGIAMAVTLGGSVNRQTIQMITEDVKQVQPLYGELQSNYSIGYVEDFTQWQLTGTNPQVNATVISETNRIVLRGMTSNTSPTAIAIDKYAQINITAFSVLELNMTVTQGIGYGIRFFGQYPNSTLFRIWWEGSPLDHRLGIGSESLRVNMLRQAFLATGHGVSSIARIEVYVESRPTISKGFTLEIRSLRFLSYGLESMADHQKYRAVYIDIGRKLDGGSLWFLYRVQLGVTLDADSGTTFDLRMLSGYTLFTSPFTPKEYKFSPLAGSFDIAFYPFESEDVFSEMLPTTTLALVLAADQGSLNHAELDYLDLIYLPLHPSNPLPQNPILGLYYGYFLFFLFLLPVGIAIVCYSEFFQRPSVSQFSGLVVLAVGLVCRLALAPVTSHPFDMNVLLVSARGWFQYGTIRASQGPTLPLTFFVYWIPYSVYAFLQILGFKDIILPWSNSGLLESYFVKAFPIAADVLVFFTLLSFKRSGKTFVWATFFFLNPLVIFTSSITGHYESALLFLILVGSINLSKGRMIRAGASFVASTFLQFLGFIPYFLAILRSGLEGQTRNSLFLLSLGILTLVYPPQRALLFRILLSVLGVTPSPQFSPGNYTLLGSLGLTNLASEYHVLLIVGALISVGVWVAGLRQVPHVAMILRDTCIATIAFLFLLNLPSQWIWLIPLGLFYASLVDNENLAAYTLPFGTACCFVLVSLVGSAYYLFGSNGNPILPAIESMPNGLLMFNLVTTMLGVLFLAYLRRVRGSAGHTLARSSLLIIGFYALTYSWIMVLAS